MLDKKLEDMGVSFQPTESPVWMLGQLYSARYNLTELRELVTRRPWLSYRKEFPDIGVWPDQ